MNLTPVTDLLKFDNFEKFKLNLTDITQAILADQSQF